MTFSVKSSLSEQIAEHISNKIICMEIKPEERILETAIAEELNVSRSPIREALRILEKKRLVELIPRRGATVTKLSKEFIGDLCDVLASLLQLTISKCIQNGSPDDFKKIDAAAVTAQACAVQGDSNGYYQAVFDFGIACLHSSKNQLLEQLVIELMPNVRRVLYASFTLNGDELKKNMEILRSGNQFIQAKNIEMVEKTIDTFIMKTREIVINI